MLETDYLVVGAGAAGMAFTDALIEVSDADVLMVDRRQAPGGHWNDAYPFVRLHQPSTWYGVNSRRLGEDAIVATGRDAGLYERATGAEVLDYYQRVIDEHLLPSDQVRFLGMTEFAATSGGPVLTSRLTGETTEVRVRRKVVDATYLESSVPATHTPGFAVDDGARLVTPNALVSLSEPADGYTVIGAGKTAMDTCLWLLDNGVPTGSIRWIRPRDVWVVQRRYMQPGTLLPLFVEGLSLQIEAAAEAEDVRGLFGRLEESEQLVRIDPAVEPEVYRGAILSPGELDALRNIEDVPRLGYVRHLGVDRIVLDGGTLPTDRAHVHVDCTAAGLNPAPTRPIFAPDRIILQAVQFGIAPFSHALVGHVEAVRDDDGDKNRLCHPTPLSSSPTGWIRSTYDTHRSHLVWRTEPDIHDWLERARLNPTSRIREHLEDPRMLAALGRLGANLERALTNLRRLMSETTSTNVA